MQASGIPNVGVKLSKTIAKYFLTMDNFINASKEELLKIDDLGEIIAEDILGFFKEENNILLIEKLKALGVNMVENTDVKSSILDGLTFVITGKLSHFTRDEIEKEIEDNGGKVSSSVSKKTSYVIYGEDSGSKLSKAEELNIPLLTEEEYIYKLNNKEL